MRDQDRIAFVPVQPTAGFISQGDGPQTAAAVQHHFIRRLGESEVFFFDLTDGDALLVMGDVFTHPMTTILIQIKTAGRYPAGPKHAGKDVSRSFDVDFTGRMTARIRSFWVKVTLEDFTGPADIHLLVPAAMTGSAADGAVDEPAELTGIEFPRRTGFFFV